MIYPEAHQSGAETMLLLRLVDCAYTKMAKGRREFFIRSRDFLAFRLIAT